MKAWTDLEKSVSFYWTGDRENPKSLWYIDHGIKIEKFLDGKIELNNAMVSGDFYRPVSNEYRKVFEHEGWLAGCYEMCIDTYTYRMLNVIDLIKKHPEEIDLLKRKENIEKKLKRYLDLRELL